eukprot:gnl/TRDRNA2_/TRDRNA2_181136_c0_seq1.p2 gnl/TRDRNA2_/TRDRNA2_181136_c0~~gnl/TRDRNA2_/TRDRNA2_181136_c0_seq1.p2  ORF type:complete len:213 (+),score=45.22 gnl/TRDRNA2_/TRDRNA2_181136_c0_seq1:96-734(+)
MLPIGKVQSGRDWMEIFTVLVWATVILIMFLAKLKAMQDVLLCAIMGFLMLLFNADALFASQRWYKIFVVLRETLKKDCLTTLAIALTCLMAHGVWHEARWPGVAMHIASLLAWVCLGIQTSPLVSCGLHIGGKNIMTKLQLKMRIGAQICGGGLAFCLFGMWWSFKFPGEGPFRHFFGIESFIGAVVTVAGSIANARQRDAKTAAKAAKEQ